jgi:hypothetical protein
MTQLQGELGLGTITYLLWVDIFNMLQISVLIIGLLETLIVHRMIQCHENVVAHEVDRVCRSTITFGIYPVSIAGILLVGNQQHVLGYVVFAIGLPAVLIYTYWKTTSDLLDRWRRQKQVVAVIGETDEGAEEYQPLLERAFRLFDADESGTVDVYELRLMLHMLFPQLDRFQLSEALHKLRTQEGIAVQGEVEFADFVSTVKAFSTIMKEAPPLTKAATMELSSKGWTHAGSAPRSQTINRLRGLVSLVGLRNRRSVKPISPAGTETVEGIARRAQSEMPQHMPPATSSTTPLESSPDGAKPHAQAGRALAP